MKTRFVEIDCKGIGGTTAIEKDCSDDAVRLEYVDANGHIASTMFTMVTEQEARQYPTFFYRTDRRNSGQYIWTMKVGKVSPDDIFQKVRFTINLLNENIRDGYLAGIEEALESLKVDIAAYKRRLTKNQFNVIMINMLNSFLKPENKPERATQAEWMEIFLKHYYAANIEIKEE